jgi:hypothetical protein
MNENALLYVAIAGASAIFSALILLTFTGLLDPLFSLLAAGIAGAATFVWIKARGDTAGSLINFQKVGSLRDHLSVVIGCFALVAVALALNYAIAVDALTLSPLAVLAIGVLLVTAACMLMNSRRPVPGGARSPEVRYATSAPRRGDLMTAHSTSMFGSSRASPSDLGRSRRAGFADIAVLGRGVLDPHD